MQNQNRLFNNEFCCLRLKNYSGRYHFLPNEESFLAFTVPITFMEIDQTSLKEKMFEKL